MLHAMLKTVHLLSFVVWIGGMFFTLYCLRPALGLLEGPSRVRLMHGVLQRFFGFVAAAAALVLVSGVWLVGRAAQAAAQAGGRFNMPLDWYVMLALGLLMVLIFGYIRLVLFTRLTRAAGAQAWQEGAQVLGQIRNWVLVNLCLGVLIIGATQLGRMS
jgi:uncharacterized membrane protein